MWRYGFETPRNDNDHETNCGGFGKQWNYPNKGMCGVCGDAYDIDQPRPNELGGKYGRGVIGANLTSNQILEVEIELTAYHRGYIQMRLCPHNRRDRPVAQTCLDKHLLSLTSGGQKFYPKPPEQVGRFYKIQYNLPADLTCSLCVLQWRYVAGNNWGNCPEGPGGWECGNQEEFRACADVHITTYSGWFDTTPNEDIDEDGRVRDLTEGSGASSVFKTIFIPIVITIFYLSL